MKLPLIKKLFLSLIILVIIIFAICIIVLYPTIKTIISLGSEITEIQQEVEEKYDLSKKLRRSLQEIDQVEKNTNQYAKAYIKRGDELSIITALENMATENNIDQTINITFIENQPTDKNALAQYYKISFVNNGYFSDQISYLDSLNKLPYYLIIQNINLEKRNKKSGEINPLTLTFEARIYVENK
ncbi:MAG TPA: hypothetical protein PK831_00915 [Candidatus Magasanikbacteria bacterium]|nr:hypothetical protein [Candidatus Magasanikbacteria bacterium]HQF57050.1 hypothetical protein [Candidatus Magasanikbacteria bacterium]